MALDYTITFNGLTIGNGTNIPITNIQGLENLPGINSSDIQLARADGELAGTDWLKARDVVVEFMIFDSGAGNYFTTIAAVSAAFSRGTAESVLSFQLPGRSARQINARCRVREIPVTREYGYKKATGRAEFHATDPRIYAATSSNVVMGLIAGGGMTFPLTFPLTFGAGSDSDGVAVNDGTTDAPWTATITGPVTTPRLTLASSGAFIELNGNVPSGSTLIIDSATQSVLLDGSPRPSWQTLLSRWWALPPGTNTVRYRAASGTGSCSLTWRSSWL